MKTDFPHSGRRLCDYALSGLLTGWQILCRVAINRYVSLISLFFFNIKLVYLKNLKKKGLSGRLRAHSWKPLEVCQLAMKAEQMPYNFYQHCTMF